MKFGKDFRTHLEETMPEWRDKFLRYKPLKKLIKHHLPQEPVVFPDGWVGLEEWFVRILDVELNKFNDFVLDKEEEFIIRLQELKERIQRVRASQNGALSSKREFDEDMFEIRKAYVTIHGEMVLLKNYSSLNFAGLVKILKKYDKRTGALLSLPFTQRALHQPFFTTEPLTRLVRECEDNLDLLFPMEAEVVESCQPEKAESSNCTTNNPEASSAQDDTEDVFRSTLAAMKAIQQLRKASSTYSPLSLAQFFHGNDNENGSGIVTDDNSASNSLSNSSQDKDADEKSVHSGD